MDFTVGSALRVGWETYKTRPWFFAGVSVLIGVAWLAVAALIEAVSGISSLMGSLVGVFLVAPVSMGITSFYLAAHANPETATISDLWHLRPYWKFVGASLLLWPLSAIGEAASGISYALLTVASAMILVWVMFTPFIVIDQELGPVDAILESIRLVRGHYWLLMGLVIAQGLIAAAGLTALLVGILVALPVIALSSVQAYRILFYKAGPRADIRR